LPSFSAQTDAVSAVAQAQRTLFEYSEAGSFPGSAQVRVRIGLHTGEPTQFGSDDYSGIDVHRAARISAAGHGGQVLLSHTTHDLVEAICRPTCDCMIWANIA
jgi:class 3 adenylate cyclase